MTTDKSCFIWKEWVQINPETRALEIPEDAPAEAILSYQNWRKAMGFDEKTEHL